MSDDYKKFELVEFRTTLICTIIIIIIFVMIMVYASVALFITIGFVEGVIGLIIILPITAVAVLIFIWVLRAPGGIRRFTITSDFIKIQIPNRPLFQINWSDIDGIEVISRMIFDPDINYNKTSYNFNFQRSGNVRSFKISCIAPLEFSLKGLRKVIAKLEEFSFNKNKQFLFQE